MGDTNLELNRDSLGDILQIVRRIKEGKYSKLVLDVSENISSDRELLISAIYQILDLEQFLEVKIKNFPYCLLSYASDHIFFEKKFRGVKLKKCRECRYDFKCRGLKKGLFRKWGEKVIQPQKDLPEEIILEVESGCNYRCPFCFNLNSFASKGRIVANLNSGYVKKIIDQIKKAGIRIIRFTGGEPLLRKDILELLEYAKSKNLEVRLNTNATLIDKKIARRLSQIVDNILIPINTLSAKEESILSGNVNSFHRKIESIILLKKYGIKIVRAGTVATPKNIRRLEKFLNLVLKLRLDDWEFYRIIPTIHNKVTNSKEDMKVLVDKILSFKKLTGHNFLIANGIPFCFLEDRNKTNAASGGALAVDGHIRYVIDPRGFAKPDYYIKKNIGDPLDVLGCWNHPFMKKMRTMKFVPRECRDCSFLEKCCGGSRYISKVSGGSYSSRDPLMPD